MSGEPPCHVEPTLLLGQSNQEPVASAAKFKLIMEELQGPSETASITIDTRHFSDKVPLTDLHLCRYNDCNSHKSDSPQSPLDPIKTNLLFALIVLLFLWAIIYFVLMHYKVL